MEKGKIIIGSKNIMNYISAVVVEFETNVDVEVSAMGTNINKQERVIKLLSKLGVKEIGRESTKINGVQAMICKLRRCPNQV